VTPLEKLPILFIEGSWDSPSCFLRIVGTPFIVHSRELLLNGESIIKTVEESPGLGPVSDNEGKNNS